MIAEPFLRQVELLLQVLPQVAVEETFALKGGTAINLFIRDMPRLSVDVDLTYLPIEDRETSLARISQGLEKIESRIQRSLSGTSITRRSHSTSGRLSKLLVSTKQARIKIEPNEVIRGAVYPAEQRDLSEKVQSTFGMFVSAQTLSLADLFGGKICAALDRQHPRDLFDIKILLDEEGITSGIRKAFVVYLASHRRPMSELLNPNQQDFRDVFESEFLGMTDLEVTYEELYQVRERLVSEIKSGLTDPERKFLLFLKQGRPKWNLLGVEAVERLPAVQWKLMNIKRMNRESHQRAVDLLKRTLEL